MPKIVLQPQTKGLVQETGTSVVAAPAGTQTLSGNGQTITMSSGLLVPVDAGGSARTGTLLGAGAADGALVILQNRGQESIDFASQATSALSGSTGTNLTLLTGSTVMLVWNSGDSVWHLASQTLS